MRSSRVLRLGVGFKPRTPPPSRPPRSPSSLNRLSEAKRAKPGKPGVFCLNVLEAGGPAAPSSWGVWPSSAFLEGQAAPPPSP